MAAIIAGALLLLGACDVSAAQPQLSPRATLPDVSTWTWGPYRPNLYFGIRPMVPETFLMGLMWANGDSQSSMLDSTDDALASQFLTVMLTAGLWNSSAGHMRAG